MAIEPLKPKITGTGGLFKDGEIPEEYNDWFANDPQPFLDLFNNIWNFFMVKSDNDRDMSGLTITTSFRHAKYVIDDWGGEHIYPDSKREVEIGLVHPTNPHAVTMAQRWLMEGERNPHYWKHGSTVDITYDRSSTCATNLTDPDEYNVMVNLDRCSGYREFGDDYNGGLFYGTNSYPKVLEFGAAPWGGAYTSNENYVFNIAGKDGVSYDNWSEYYYPDTGAEGWGTPSYIADYNSYRREIIDIENIVTATTYQDGAGATTSPTWDEWVLKRLMLLLRMYYFAETTPDLEVRKFKVRAGPGAVFCDPGEFYGFMSNREQVQWAFTGRSSPHESGGADGLYKHNYFGDKLEDKLDPMTVATHRGYPWGKDEGDPGRAETVSAKVALERTSWRGDMDFPRWEPYYTAQVDFAKFETTANYESFIDLLRALIVELSENLADGRETGYNEFPDEHFEDSGYVDFGLETFATSATFVNVALIEGIIKQIIAPNNPLQISDELRDWWYGFAAMSGVAVPDISDLGISFELSNLGVKTVDIDVCYPEGVPNLTPVTCPTCVPNPSAFVPVWTEENSPFLNQKTCEYSLTMLTSFPQPEDAALDPDTWETRREEASIAEIPLAIDTMIGHYNKPDDFYLEVYIRDDLTSAGPTIIVGEEAIEAAETKKPVYSLSNFSGGVSPSESIVYYFTGFPQEILTDIDSELEYTFSFPQNGYSQKALVLVNTGAILTKYARISSYEIAATPLTSKMKVLVGLPAGVFDLIPDDDTPEVEVEGPEPPPYVVLELIPRIRKGSHDQDFRVMVRRVSAALGWYGQQYAGYIHTNPDDAYGYSDLNLVDEGKYLREFKGVLNDFFKENGLNFRRVEKFRINFEDPEAGGTPYRVKNVKIYDCDDNLIKLKSGFSKFRNSHPVNRIRTMAYVANLPSMANDCTAREAVPWQQFLEKYTYPFNQNFGASDPQSAGGCAFESLVEDPLKNLVNGIAHEIMTFPDALGNAYNQKLCNETCDQSELEIQLNDIDEMMKRMMEASFLEHFAGDSVLQFLPEILAGNTSGIEELWSEAFDKMGWCAIIYLLQNALECLMAGLEPDEIFRNLMKKALEGLTPVQLERMFIGLPPDKQKEVREAITGEFAGIPAPWDQGYRAGSYSGGGKTLEGDYFANLSGEKALDADGNPTEYVPKTTGVGSIANAADGSLDIIMNAYIGGIWDVFGEDGLDELYEMLQAVPGGELIAKILKLSECALPPMFEPPIADFLKTLELDFCRNHYAITLPKFSELPNFADMWAIFKLVLVEVLKILLVKILMMIMKTIFDILFGLLCALLEAAGTALNAALTGNNVQDALRDAFCGLGASEDAVNAAAAELVSALSLDPTCLQPTDADVALLFEDISVAISQEQLADLLDGTESLPVGKIIYEMIQTQPERLGAFACIFPSPNSIADFFKAMGHLVPQEYKTRPARPDTPLNIGLCGDPAAIALQNEYQCALLMEKGVPAEKCNELIDKLRCKNMSTLDDLNNVMQNGIDDLLPPIYASACGEEGILPDQYSSDYMPAAIAIDAAAGGLFAALARKHNRDLLKGHGFLNMVLSDRHGRGLRGHNNLVRFFAAIRPVLDGDHTITDLNLFPPTIAEHLRKTLEDYGNGGVVNVNPDLGVEVHGKNYFFLTADDASWKRPKVWEEDEGEWVSQPNVNRKAADLRLHFDDYKVGKEISRNDNPYSFNLYYTHFDVAPDGVPYFGTLGGKGEGLDFYRIYMDEAVWTEPGSNSLADAATEPFLDAEGAAPIPAPAYHYMTLLADESNSPDYTYSDGPEYADGGLDVEEGVRNTKKDPHSVAFARLIRKRIEDNWDPDRSVVTTFGSTSPARMLDADVALDVFERVVKNQIYPLLVTNMFNRSAYFLSKNSRAFTFGYNEEAMQPDIVYLNNENGYVEEEYFGTELKPSYYVDTPKNSGWMSILDALVPPDDACPPDDQGLGLWDDITDTVNECSSKFIEDERLRKDPSCFIEKPFDKLLSKGTSAMLEGVIMATLRVHTLEILLKGMANFSILKPSFPEHYDDLLSTVIMESVINSLQMEGERPKKKRKDYYYAFLEQVVQNFGKKVDAGMIELEEDSAEYYALEELRQSQVDFMKTKAIYPDGEEVLVGGEEVTVGQHLRSMTSSPVDEALKAAINGGSSSSAITNSVGKLRKREKYRMIYWRQHMDKKIVKDNCKIILKRYISEELEEVSKQFSRLLDLDKRAVPNFESILFGSKPTTTLFEEIDDISGNPVPKPGNPGSLWMWGSLQASGHYNMSDGPWDVADDLDRLASEPQFDIHAGYEFLPSTDMLSESVDDYMSKTKFYWPFLLEKYIIFSFKEDGSTPPAVIDALAADGLEENTVIRISRFAEHVRYLPPADHPAGGVEVSLPNPYSGLSSGDCFESLKYGMRICFVPPNDIFSAKAEHEVTDASGLFGSTVESSYSDIEIMKAIAAKFGSAEKRKHKAFNLNPAQHPGANYPSFLYPIPLVSSETPVSSADLSGFNGTSYNNFVNCLIADMVTKAEYKTIFEYCLPFARFNSIWATYTINAFLPSIGKADPDYKKVSQIKGPKWTNRDDALDNDDVDEPDDLETNAGEFGGVGTGNDGWIAKPVESGGGKPVTFTPSFKNWDQQTFRRSKKFARIMFNTSYKGDDSEYSNDRNGSKADRKQLRPFSNLDLGFGWAFKRRQRPRPIDACEDDE